LCTLTSSGFVGGYLSGLSAHYAAVTIGTVFLSGAVTLVKLKSQSAAQKP